MESFLRQWRQAAESRKQYDTAIFVGDKVLALTGNDEDAIHLARLHFSSGNHSRAQNVLSHNSLVERYAECKYLSAFCYVKENRFEDALNVLGQQSLTRLTSRVGDDRRKLVKTDGQTRNGISKSHNPIAIHDDDRPAENNATKFIAGMSYLRGLCYANQNSFDRAKECYKDAVRIDVQCFEAFDQLVKNTLMTPDEEWAFLESLDFDSISKDLSSSQEAGELVRMLYTTRLSKYKNPQELANAVETLSTHYKLASNPDIILSKAHILFTQCRFRDALTLTTSILEQDRYNFSALPVHLACLHELDEKNALFLLSHDLADRYPDEPSSWLAVGVYYLTTEKVSEARRWFSKASMMDPHFGPAWIGFAHTFAAEGEHDQAISAYATASRLFQGTHLPQLFLGMQNLQLQNYTLAREYFTIARALCDSDPLLLSEMGVASYYEGNHEEAIEYLSSALELADESGADPRQWVSTRSNLGHAYRRANRWEEALENFDVCARISGSDASIFAAKGLCLLELAGQADIGEGPAGATAESLLWEAIAVLHECLTINPQDAAGSELLAKALDESAARAMMQQGNGGLGDDGDEEQHPMDEAAEQMLEERKAAIRSAPSSSRVRNGRALSGPSGIGRT